MWPMVGAAISAGSSLLSGMFSSSAQKSANEANLAEAQRTREFNAQQAQLARDQSQAQFEVNRQLAERNIDLQKEFAQSGIRWKVADAEAAGLHPLYALGGSGATYSPVSVAGGGSAAASGSPGSVSADTGFASGLSRAGQDIGRAVTATMTADERYDQSMKALTLQRGELENQLLSSQIAKINSAANPPTPSVGESDWMQQQQKGSGRGSGGAAYDPRNPHQTLGAIPDIQYARTESGRFAIVPSDKMKEAIEDSPYEWMHFARQVKNKMGGAVVQGPFPPPAGQMWKFYPDEMSVGLVRIPRQLLPSNPFFNLKVDPEMYDKLTGWGVREPGGVP